MNADEARALFDAALDGELDESTRADFEQALAQDVRLREEYEKLERLSKAASALAADAPPVDLLSGVQQKLRARSGGRFYRDKFSEQRGTGSQVMWMLVLCTVIVLAIALWLAVDPLGGPKLAP